MWWTKKKKEREYKFSVLEICSVGDRYEYKVKATSKKEAFKKLFIWFFAKKWTNEEIKSKHFTVTQPNKEVFIVNGMPRWFGRVISGSSDKNSHISKKEYAKKHNINLDH